MDEALKTLSEREKQTLRLLTAGHDAKSVALHLGLSVYTVNERLRTARRKLGASSSREAARRLAQIEQSGPDFLGDPKNLGNKNLGEAEGADHVEGQGHSQSRGGIFTSRRIGGLLVMLSIIAAALVYAYTISPASQAPDQPGSTPAASQPSAPSEGADVALAWIALLDRAQWIESWTAAGATFKAQLTPDSWAASVQPVRAQVGPVVSRVQQSATRTTTLPGAPAGDYEIIQYRTAFRDKPEAIETVVLIHKGAAWKVNGYFVR